MKRTVLPIVAAVAAILGMISVARTRPQSGSDGSALGSAYLKLRAGRRGSGASRS